MKRFMVSVGLTLAALCTQANATSGWTTSAAIDETNIGTVTTSDSTWVLLNGISSEGNCGTTTYNSTTYVLFELKTSQIGGASTTQNALQYQEMLGRAAAELFMDFHSGAKTTIKWDDSDKDGGGFCYIQAVRSPS